MTEGLKKSNSFQLTEQIDNVEINAFTLGNVFNDLICSNDNVMGILLGTTKLMNAKKQLMDDPVTTNTNMCSSDNTLSSPSSSYESDSNFVGIEDDTPPTISITNTNSSSTRTEEKTPTKHKSSSPLSPHTRSSKGSTTSSGSVQCKYSAIIQAIEICATNEFVDPITGEVKKNVLEKLMRKYKDSLHLQILGWFRFRPHTRLQPSFLDATAHRQIVEYMKAKSLIFAIMTLEQKPNKESLFSFRFRFLELSKSEKRTIDLEAARHRTRHDKKKAFFKPLASIPHTITNYINEEAINMTYLEAVPSIYTQQVPHTNKMETIVHKTLKTSKLLEEYTQTLITDLKSTYHQLKESEKKIRSKQEHIYQLQQQLAVLRERQKLP